MSFGARSPPYLYTPRRPVLLQFCCKQRLKTQSPTKRSTQFINSCVRHFVFSLRRQHERDERREAFILSQMSGEAFFFQRREEVHTRICLLPLGSITAHSVYRRRHTHTHLPYRVVRLVQLKSCAAPELLVAVQAVHSIADRDASLHSPHSPLHEYDAHSTSATHCAHAPQAKPLRTRLACVYGCCEIDACEFGVVPFVSYSRSHPRTTIRPFSSIH